MKSAGVERVLAEVRGYWMDLPKCARVCAR